ncbi:hypothetical protein JKP88DRAFT_252976 [Tribonema minus]|uniref:Uncharacterized protein n=1 Tax=Tribonema minus TaxID=303371 RepID=A0A836CL13_9STRA|nr:hypothetical protein JKP88DRAFT_252976 [Tribonema minus]
MARPSLSQSRRAQTAQCRSLPRAAAAAVAAVSAAGAINSISAVTRVSAVGGDCVPLWSVTAAAANGGSVPQPARRALVDEHRHAPPPPPPLCQLPAPSTASVPSLASTPWAGAASPCGASPLLLTAAAALRGRRGARSWMNTVAGPQTMS